MSKLPNSIELMQMPPKSEQSVTLSRQDITFKFSIDYKLIVEQAIKQWIYGKNAHQQLKETEKTIPTLKPQLSTELPGSNQKPQSTATEAIIEKVLKQALWSKDSKKQNKCEVQPKTPPKNATEALIYGVLKKQGLQLL